MRRIGSFLSVLVLVSALGAAAVLPAAASPPGEVVATDAGKVRGETADGIRVFEGIPYAAPPVGERRWRAPDRAAPWPGVRDATSPGPICPQLGWSEDGSPVVSGSEDCLSLNVWTPVNASSSPVLVFVHGGGFTTGAGSLYDPSAMVARGNVVVTVNYRLGALGFLDHPGLRDPGAGNFGLADQQAALRWVQRNAAAFGGDPRRVTLWGESAGGFSTCAQLVSPGARGLFQQAIVQSAPCLNDFVPQATAERRGLRTAADLGCADPRTAVECLRDKPFQELTGLNEDPAVVNRKVADRPWLPVTGTHVVPFQPSIAHRLGLAADVPIIHGGTKDEARSFVGSRYDDSGNPMTAEQYPVVVREMYGERAARKILAAYPLTAYPTPSLAFAQILTDEGKLVGACSQLPANDLMKRGAPVYAYEFAEPRTQQPGEFPYGAHHGVDIRYFFDSTDPGPWTPPPLTPEQEQLADRLLDQWTAFARTGSPGAGWKAYEKDVVRSISAARTAPIDLRAEHQCDFWESI
jgi:para-nitrobenzyl esterase